ncbi:hypothetical protein TNIN_81201, partial [Trichonephila inaurata madagascariensis]
MYGKNGRLMCVKRTDGTAGAMLMHAALMRQSIRERQ